MLIGELNKETENKIKKEVLLFNQHCKKQTQETKLVVLLKCMDLYIEKSVISALQRLLYHDIKIIKTLSCL